MPLRMTDRQRKTLTTVMAAIVAPFAVWALTAGTTASLHAISHVETRAHAESVFVRKDTFAIHLAGEALVHRTDSLVIEARTARIDTALNALLRACRRKGECP
jgi:hypothetical protein